MKTFALIALLGGAEATLQPLPGYGKTQIAYCERKEE